MTPAPAGERGISQGRPERVGRLIPRVYPAHKPLDKIKRRL